MYFSSPIKTLQCSLEISNSPKTSQAMNKFIRKGELDHPISLSSLSFHRPGCTLNKTTWRRSVADCCGEKRGWKDDDLVPSQGLGVFPLYRTLIKTRSYYLDGGLPSRSKADRDLLPPFKSHRNHQPAKKKPSLFKNCLPQDLASLGMCVRNVPCTRAASYLFVYNY